MSCRFSSMALYTCPTSLPTWAMSLTNGPGGEIHPCRERFSEWILGNLWTPVIFDLRKGPGGCRDGGESLGGFPGSGKEAILIFGNTWRVRKMSIGGEEASGKKMQVVKWQRSKHLDQGFAYEGWEGTLWHARPYAKLEVLSSFWLQNNVFTKTPPPCFWAILVQKLKGLATFPEQNEVCVCVSKSSRFLSFFSSN